MGIEIERRFLVQGVEWKEHKGIYQALKQGYLAISKAGWTIRIRIINDKEAWITLKAPAKGIAQYEFEYMIPIKDAEEIWPLLERQVIKLRYEITLHQKNWVVDIFQDENEPLVLAEVELSSANEEINPPSWCWMEITGRKEWSNAALAMNPISSWTKEKRALYNLD